MQFGLKDLELQKIQKVFEKYPEVDVAILYGSRAKGTFQTYSDIDITLKGKDLNLSIKGKIEDDLDDLLLPYKMDITLYNFIKNEDLINHINRIGKIVYQHIEV